MAYIQGRAVSFREGTPTEFNEYRYQKVCTSGFKMAMFGIYKLNFNGVKIISSRRIAVISLVNISGFVQAIYPPPQKVAFHAVSFKVTFV